MQQNKAGIRLRHLQRNLDNQQDEGYFNYQQIPLEEHKIQGQTKVNKNRSISPRNRRKIFQTENEKITIMNEPSRQNSYEMQGGKNNLMMQRNDLGKKLSNNSEIEKDAEVQRLIFSLKQKSIQLQKKDEIIKRLRKEIENLNIENRQYRREIAQLREQYGKQANTRDDPNKFYAFAKKTHVHVPYEELQPQSESPQFISKQPTSQSIQKPNTIISSPNTAKQQPIFSPLMALQSGNSKSSSSSSSTVKQYDFQNPVKSQETLNVANKSQRGFDNNIRYNKMVDSVEQFHRSSNSYQSSLEPPPLILENPFKKSQLKFHRQQNILDKIQPIPKQNVGRREQQNSFKQQDYFPKFENSGKSSKVPEFCKRESLQNSKKASDKNSLAIDNSKQFQFEDFDFNDGEQSGVFF